jgi:ABC transporter substrate binding protein
MPITMLLRYVGLMGAKLVMVRAIRQGASNKGPPGVSEPETLDALYLFLHQNTASIYSTHSPVGFTPTVTRRHSNNDIFLFTARKRLVELTANHSINAINPNRGFPEAGRLMSYGSFCTASVKQVGVYVGRIIKGARPADLPVMQPTKYELVINLKTAKSLGLEIPPSLLARADEVIE